MRMFALSVRQPWASLIVWGLKRIEIRSWTTSYRGPLVIHASKSVDQQALSRYPLGSMVHGALVGTVRLTAVERFTPSTWAERREDHLDLHPLPADTVLYAWHLSEPHAWAEPIRYRGERGLFDVEVPEPEREEA